MEPREVEARIARVLKRTKWVLTPVAIVLMGLTILGLVAGSALGSLAFVLLVVLAIGWNVGFVIWRWRLRRTITVPEPTAGLERDDHTGVMHPAREARFPRLGRRIRSTFRASAFDASAGDSRNDVHWRLYEAAETEGATFAWYPAGDAVVVDVAVRAPDTRETTYMHMRGTLAGDGPAELHGSIGPDGQMRLFSIAPVAIMVGGLVAMVGGLANLAFGNSHESDWYLALWGTGAAFFGAVWIWNHTKAYVIHLRILRRAFGDQVRFMRN